MVPKMPVMPPPVKMRTMIAVRVPIPRKISEVRPRITPVVATPAPVGHRIRYHNRYRPDTCFSPACFPLQTSCSSSRRSCLSPCCCFSRPCIKSLRHRKNLFNDISVPVNINRSIFRRCPADKCQCRQKQSGNSAFAKNSAFFHFSSPIIRPPAYLQDTYLK